MISLNYNSATTQKEMLLIAAIQNKQSQSYSTVGSLEYSDSKRLLSQLQHMNEQIFEHSFLGTPWTRGGWISSIRNGSL